MPRPVGRGINLKFNKQGKFDPEATVGKLSYHKAINKYLATTKDKKRQQAKAYCSYNFDLFDATRHADKRGYSNAKCKRKQQTILDRGPPDSDAVNRRLRKWAWKELAQQKCVLVPRMKKMALRAEKDKK